MAVLLAYDEPLIQDAKWTHNSCPTSRLPSVRNFLCVKSQAATVVRRRFILPRPMLAVLEKFGVGGAYFPRGFAYYCTQSLDSTTPYST